MTDMTTQEQNLMENILMLGDPGYWLGSILPSMQELNPVQMYLLFL